VTAPVFAVRPAVEGDIPALERLVDRSIRHLARGHYDERQIDSALEFLYGVDSQLVRDRTYFVVEAQAAIVACGGWSWRRTPFGGDNAGPVRDGGRRAPGVDAAVIRAFFVDPEWTRRGLGRLVLTACEQAARGQGFDRFELTSTAMGRTFYASCGYREHERTDIVLPDGVTLPHVHMVKP